MDFSSTLKYFLVSSVQILSNKFKNDSNFMHNKIDFLSWYD